MQLKDNQIRRTVTMNPNYLHIVKIKTDLNDSKFKLKS